MARSKGAGSVEAFKDGHRLRWTNADGERHSVVFRPSKKREAEARLRELQAGRVPEPEPSPKRVLFLDFVQEYLAYREPDLAIGTVRNIRSMLNTTLKSFEKLTLDQLDQRKIDFWWSRHAAQPVQRRNSFFALRAMMKVAYRWGYIPKWQVEIDGAGRDVAKPRPAFEVADMDKVLQHLPEHYRPIVLVIFAGHLRLGEAIGLDAQDYDRKTGVITVTRQRTKEGSTSQTKTGQHKRIKLLQRGIDALDSIPARIAGPLFPGVKAERMPRKSLQDAWESAREAAGLPDLRLHDVRHIGLSLVNEVAGIVVAQERAGHASSTSTRRYLHTSARVHEEAVERLDALIRRIS